MSARELNHSPIDRDPRVCWALSSSPETVLFHSRYNHEFIPHMHDDTTILIVTDGAVELGVGPEKYPVSKGQLAIIGAHQVHSARPLSPRGWKMRSIHLPARQISDATKMSVSECAQMHFANPVQTEAPIGASFQELHSCIETMNGSDNDLQSFIKDFYNHIDRFHPTRCDENSMNARVVRAKRMMTEAMSESMQLDEIAEEIGLSVFSFIRQFQKAFGISPHAWRMQARVNEAARLLRQGKQAADTAVECGFADQSHMTRTFKKVFGITPRQYCTVQ